MRNLHEPIRGRDCFCPGCRVTALRDTWREDEAPPESGVEEARADLAREGAEIPEGVCP